jgi:cobalt-zinc-cadmium efflux system membrane fusion protein
MPFQRQPQPPIAHQDGQSSLAAIVAVIVIGVILGALILTMDRKQSSADDDDNQSAAATQTASGAVVASRVDIDDVQTKAAGISVEAAGPARIVSFVQFPGEVQLNDDRTVHVVPRVAGIAEHVPVATGQSVRQGQLLAIFSSQLISEQRSALQTAERRLEHMRGVYEREKRLWEQKISAERDYLEAQHALEEAQIGRDNALQKLRAVGVSGSGKALNRFELYAPYDGLVVERNLSIGEAVKEDAAIFTIADLSTVWVEVQLPAKDLPLLRVGDKVNVRATAFDAQTTGTVAFIGALVGEQTRMARARIVVNNPKGTWRPGLFVNVVVKATDVDVPIAVKTDALQSLGTQQVIFVRDGKGFVAHPVTTGRTDGVHAEIAQGLPPGTRYAAKNSYVIKSELAKQASEEGQ